MATFANVQVLQNLSLHVGTMQWQDSDERGDWMCAAKVVNDATELDTPNIFFQLVAGSASPQFLANVRVEEVTNLQVTVYLRGDTFGGKMVNVHEDESNVVWGGQFVELKTQDGAPVMPPRHAPRPCFMELGASSFKFTMQTDGDGQFAVDGELNPFLLQDEADLFNGDYDHILDSLLVGDDHRLGVSAGGGAKRSRP